MLTSPTKKYMLTSQTKNICTFLRQKITAHFSEKPFLLLSPTDFTRSYLQQFVLISLKLSLFGYRLRQNLFARIPNKVLLVWLYVPQKFAHFYDRVRFIWLYLRQSLFAPFPNISYAYLVISPTKFVCLFLWQSQVYLVICPTKFVCLFSQQIYAYLVISH